MADADEPLVMRRSRRSTAGNRMEAALAELALQPQGQEDPEAEDVDFIAKEEEDVFESDFASTDDEADKEEAAGEAGDKSLQEEEKKTKKAARARVERATRAAHDRQKVTFNPEAHASTSRPNGGASRAAKPKTKLRRRVSLGVAVDAETGEVVDPLQADQDGDDATKKKRQSRRRSTIENTNSTVVRMRESQERRASLPKKSKPQTRALTQDALIARALDMEEGNITEHKNYLTVEEEKRKRAKVVRPVVEGPLVRWVSRAEEIQVEVPRPVGYDAHMPAGHPSASAAGDWQPQPSLASTAQPQSHLGTSQYGYAYTGWAAKGESPGAAAYNYFASSAYNVNKSAPPSTSVFPAAAPGSTNSAFIAWPPPPPPPSPPRMPTPPPVLETWRVTKNYVVHELGQAEKTPKPSWRRTMEALFGDHVRWEDLRVYVGKGRPLSRPIQSCPLTGLPAKYLDPRTGVPFANLKAYRTLMGVLEHAFVWNDALGCYVGREGDSGISGTGPASSNTDRRTGASRMAVD